MSIGFLISHTHFEFKSLLAVKVITSYGNLKIGNYGGISIKGGSRETKMGSSTTPYHISLPKNQSPSIFLSHKKCSCTSLRPPPSDSLAGPHQV